MVPVFLLGALPSQAPTGRSNTTTAARLSEELRVSYGMTQITFLGSAQPLHLRNFRSRAMHGLILTRLLSRHLPPHRSRSPTKHRQLQQYLITSSTHGQSEAQQQRLQSSGSILH